MKQEKWAILITEKHNRDKVLDEDFSIAVHDQIYNANNLYKEFLKKNSSTIITKPNLILNKNELIVSNRQKGVVECIERYDLNFNFAIFRQETNGEQIPLGDAYNNNNITSFEIYKGHGDNVFVESDYFFSGRFKTTIENLKNIFSDFLIEIFFENEFKTHNLYKPVFSKNKANYKKLSQINKRAFSTEVLKVSSNYHFYTFVTLIRDGRLPTSDYFAEIKNCWGRFIEWTIKKIELEQKAEIIKNNHNLPPFRNYARDIENTKFEEVRNPIELFDLIPPKIKRQISYKNFVMQFERLGFNQKSYLIILRKSLIDRSKNKKNRITMLFKSKHKINSLRILDFDRLHQTKKVADLLNIINFIKIN